MYAIVVLAIMAVALVLVIGIAGFAMGGEFNRKYGNKLMRLRLLLQFIAIALILLFIYMRSQGG